MISYNPSIVRDGLVLHLDAANVKSYPGTGTVWKDLSGNGNNGTLVNGVGYDSANNGSMVFDGVDDYSSHPYSSLLNMGTQMTIQAFVKIKNVNVQSAIFSSVDVTTTNTYTEGYSLYYAPVSSYGINAKTIRFQFGQNGWAWNVYGANGLTISDNNYHYICITALNLNTNSHNITFYIDGNAISGTFWYPRAGVTPNSIRYSSNINSPRIANLYYPTRPSYEINYGNIDIGSLHIYNRALSAAEIQQNFNATRGRYGI